jgi:hypothetical protein
VNYPFSRDPQGSADALPCGSRLNGRGGRAPAHGFVRVKSALSVPPEGTSNVSFESAL